MYVECMYIYKIILYMYVQIEFFKQLPFQLSFIVETVHTDGGGGIFILFGIKRCIHFIIKFNGHQRVIKPK